MRFAAVTLKKYLSVSWKYFVVIFIGQSISTISRSFYDSSSSGLQSLLVLIALIVAAWAGWAAVKGHGFSLKQAGFVGFLLSFGTHWSLPIFHSFQEVLYYFAVNSVIFIAVAAFGGWLAVMRR